MSHGDVLSFLIARCVRITVGHSPMNVIKVVWGRMWDPLFEKDKLGLLQQRMDEAVDGEYQNYKSRSGGYTRQEFFGKYPELLKMVEDKKAQINRYTRNL